MAPFNLFPSRSLFNSCFCHNTHFSPFSTNFSSCLHYLHLFLLSMKRSSTTSKGGGEEKNGGKHSNEEVVIEWEVRPCGLLVQKRSVESSVGANSGGPMIKIKVSHDSYYHDVTVPAHSTFGDLKRILEQKTGLQPKEQRLLFRGKEKDDDECLHIAGLVDMSKVILLEDPGSKERKIEEMKKDKGMLAAYEAVAKVRQEVDKLSEKVVDIEKAMQKGIQVVDKEFVILTELLMVQLLKLDTIEAKSEAKIQRRIEVHRVQSFVEKLDHLKAINSSPSINNRSTSLVTMKWDTFHSGVGSLTAPVPLQNFTKVTQEWEQFD